MKNAITTIIFTTFLLTACTTKSVFVGGNFYTYDGYKAVGLMTIWNQGAKQTFFDPGTGFNSGNAYTVELNADSDRIMLGGEFAGYNGQPANRIVRIDTDGKNVGGAFGAGFNGTVHVIARDPNAPDSYLVGGEFTQYQGTPAPGIIRIKGNGDIDTSFNPGTGFAYALSSNPARVVTVAFDPPNNRVCLGGSFTSYKNVQTNNFICVNSKGGIVSGFNPGGSGFTHVPPSQSYEGEVDVIEIDEGSGDIYVSGRFNRFNGTQVTDNLVRLNSDGTFNRNYALVGQGTLRALFILADPNAIITGGKTYMGVDYNSLIKIDRDSGNLFPEFAIAQGSVNPVVGIGTRALIDGEAVNPGKLFFAGGFNVLSSATGKTVTFYNLKEHRPLLRIDKTTGAVDSNFYFSDDLAVIDGGQPANIQVLRAFAR